MDGEQEKKRILEKQIQNNEEEKENRISRMKKLRQEMNSRGRDISCSYHSEFRDDCYVKKTCEIILVEFENTRTENVKRNNLNVC